MFFGVINDGIKVVMARDHKVDGCEAIEYANVSFNKVSPEELRQEIEKQKERIMHELDAIWDEAIAPVIGMPYDRSRKQEIDKAAMLARTYFKYTWDRYIVAGPYDAALFAEELAEMARVMKTNRFHVPENTLVLSQPYCDYLVSCYDDRGEVDEVSVVVDALNVSFPAEKELFRLAAQQALYHKVSKVFRYDCEAIRDYISGDLTFKGLVRRIDPREERSCQ